jgi:hypothetical protein
MNNTPFARLAHLGEQLERTSKRREISAMLAEFLQGLSPEEIAPTVRLTIGQVFPEWDGRALNISWKTMMAVVDALTDAPDQVRDQISAQAVDGGESVTGEDKMPSQADTLQTLRELYEKQFQYKGRLA